MDGPVDPRAGGEAVDEEDGRALLPAFRLLVEIGDGEAAGIEAVHGRGPFGLDIGWWRESDVNLASVS